MTKLNIPSILIFVFSFLFFSCSGVAEKKRHNLFLKEIQYKKEGLMPAEYQAYIKQRITVKEGELQALQQLVKNQNKMMDHHNVMSESTGMETHSFNKVTTGMELKRLDTRIKNVERELFFLKSQLNSGTSSQKTR